MLEKIFSNLMMDFNGFFKNHLRIATSVGCRMTLKKLKNVFKNNIYAQNPLRTHEFIHRENIASYAPYLQTSLFKRDTFHALQSRYYSTRTNGMIIWNLDPHGNSNIYSNLRESKSFGYRKNGFIKQQSWNHLYYNGIGSSQNAMRNYSFKPTLRSNSKNLDKVKEYAYNAVPDFNRLVHEFEKMKERPKRVLIILMLIIGTLTTTLYTYWDHVKSFFGQQGAEVASMTLKSENLQRTSIEVVNNVLTDSTTTNKVVELLRDLVNKDETKVLLIGLLVRLMQDETTKEQLGILLSTQLKILIQDPNTMVLLSVFVQDLLKREDTKQNLIYLVKNVLNDPGFKQYAQEWASELVRSDLVLQSGASAGKSIVDAVLTNESVRKTGVDYLSNVVTDREVQASAGYALRHAALISINPWHSAKPKDNNDINSPPGDEA